MSTVTVTQTVRVSAFVYTEFKLANLYYREQFWDKLIIFWAVKTLTVSDGLAACPIISAEPGRNSYVNNSTLLEAFEKKTLPVMRITHQCNLKVLYSGHWKISRRWCAKSQYWWHSSLFIAKVYCKGQCWNYKASQKPLYNLYKKYVPAQSLIGATTEILNKHWSR